MDDVLICKNVFGWLAKQSLKVVACITFFIRTEAV